MKSTKLLLISILLSGCQSTSSQVSELTYSESFNPKYPVVNSDLAYKLSITPQELHEMLVSCESEFDTAYQNALQYKESEYYSFSNMKERYEALVELTEKGEPIGKQNLVSAYQYDKLEMTFLRNRPVKSPENCRVFSLHLSTAVLRYAPLYYAHEINSLIENYGHLVVDNALVWTINNPWIIQGGGKAGVRYNRVYDRFTFELSSQNIDKEAMTIKVNGQDISLDYVYEHDIEGCTHPERYKVKTKEGMEFIYNYMNSNELVTFNNFHFYNSKQFFRVKEKFEKQNLESTLKSTSAL